ncbi:hypothetical protein [Saccharopolyspora sp. NPDC049426]
MSATTITAGIGSEEVLPSRERPADRLTTREGSGAVDTAAVG